jgi:hypothetical protein
MQRMKRNSQQELDLLETRIPLDIFRVYRDTCEDKVPQMPETFRQAVLGHRPDSLSDNLTLDLISACCP